MLTKTKLHEILFYDSNADVWIWKINIGKKIKCGDVAGTKNSSGYWQIRYEGKSYLAHRLVCLYLDDQFDIDCKIDHKDGNKLNNFRSNLRITNVSNNEGNKFLSQRNTTGYKGVSKQKGNKWSAKIGSGISGKPIHIGTFDTQEMAAFAYDEAAREYFGEYARLNFPKDGEAGC